MAERRAAGAGPSGWSARMIRSFPQIQSDGATGLRAEDEQLLATLKEEADKQLAFAEEKMHAADEAYKAGLKDSVAERPNHSNF